MMKTATVLWKRVLLLSTMATVLLLLPPVATAQNTMIGDTFEVEGYIMDRFCIDRGTFLDMQDVETLKFPEQHTVHCLIDPEPCRTAVFEVLLDPSNDDDDDEYIRGYTLDQEAHDAMVELAKKVGICDLCTGEGTLKAGFRARMTATITGMADAEGAGPMISAANIEHVMPSQYKIGDTLEVEGFVMDRFCIDRGTFLDMEDVIALENPEKHTVHCLIDPEPCRTAVFEVLAEPPAGSMEYIRAFTLDQEAHDAMVELAKEVGNCTECTGEGSLVAGFRARMTATVTAMGDVPGAGPIISATDIEPVLPEYQVGDAIDVVGHIMDQFCIQRGTFLDMPDVNALENPDEHTIHCLVDPPVCRESPFEVLLPPLEGETEYQRAFTLDEPSKAFVLRVLKVVGICELCMGTGTLEKGFQARIKANIVHPFRNSTSGSGPLIRLLLADSMLPEEPEMMSYQVGDTVSMEGFVVDRFCIDRGTFLDEPNIVSLEHPELHTAHCLLDPEVCTSSPYELVMDPRPGEMTFRRAFTFDEASKAQILELARSQCSCDTCAEGGRIVRGFRTRINATIVEEGNLFSQGRFLQGDGDGAPPVIAINNVEPVVYFNDASTAEQVSVQVGDLVTVTGFIVDNFCIAQGFFLDAPDIKPLERPDLHTIHCLIDVPQCNSSTYEVLLDPATGADPPMYARGFALDEASKALVIAQAKEVGICDLCNGPGDWTRGFRATLMGTVTAVDGELPILSVQTSEPTPFLDMSMMMSMADEMAVMDDIPSQPVLTNGDIDCSSEFQASHKYDGIPLTLSYTVDVDSGTFRGQVVYEGRCF